MVARWNEAVGADDEVWHLGDFAVRQPAARIAALLDALAGTKHLIVGNNDGPATTGLPGWASVQHYAEIEADGMWLILCHYPLRSWNRIGRGALNLHGHSHGRLAPLARQVDVGVDLWRLPPDHARRDPRPSPPPRRSAPPLIPAHPRPRVGGSPSEA